MSRGLLRSAFWIGMYFTISMAPLLAMLMGPTPPGRGFWREYSVGIAFSGLSMMGLQFFLTGRFKNVTAPYGIDVVYHFHRTISLVAFSFVLLHPVILFVASPESIILLNPVSIAWWMSAGVVALAAFVVIIASSLLRRKTNLPYEPWRAIHGYGSVIAVAFSVAHIVGVNYYAEGLLKRGLWISMAAGWLLALLYVRVIVPFTMLKRPYTVAQVVAERGTTWTLTLAADGHEGMRFKPGQFAWLTVGDSPFSIKEHPFSFSSSAMEPDALQMTIKELGDFTNGIGKVKVGTRAYLDGPYGSFTPDGNGAPGFCLLAGGIGVTPALSMLRTMEDRKDERQVLLVYGSRKWEDVTFREELERLKKTLNLRVVHVLEEPPPDWSGESGRISAEILARHLPENRMEYGYFVCGPPPMQKATRVALERLGLPLDHVQSESFNFV